MRVTLFVQSIIVSVTLTSLFSCGSGDKKVTDAKDSTQTAIPVSSFSADSTKRYIYLTWDDSPQPPGTINCKRIFEETGIKATFFAVGFNQVGNKKIRLMDSIRKAYPQFLLANHSFSHGMNDKYRLFYAPAQHDSAMNDFLHNERELKIPVKIIRMPGNNTWANKGQITGQLSTNRLVHSLDSLGYQIVGWDLEWRQDAKTKQPKESATEMAQKVSQKLNDDETHAPRAIVILSHDRIFEKPAQADSLRKFIQLLQQDKRNVFETIDHYPPFKQ
jgi:peptidoglycan/xylan/chitin deacetylase (PgdA/CDA1 family)